MVPGVDAYNDLTPRVAAAYDLFGNGKTAVKFNWGRYLAYASNDAPYTSSNPAVTVVSSVANRGWTDTNGNKVVDCNLLNPAAQTVAGGDICAAAVGNPANFGQVGAATIVNPDVLHGWGKRPGDYQWTATLQQEIMPRVSADVSYTRRNFFGFFVTDDLNRNVNTAYETYTLTAPLDPRLPNGGGYPITVYTPTAAANAVPSKTYLTWESDYGPERTSLWHGVDINLNARLRAGLITSIGTTTGRAIVDTCATATKYNQVNAATSVAAGPDPRGCHNEDPFQTQVRGLASYTIPKVDVQVSATVRSQPPVLARRDRGGTSASWVVPNSLVAGGARTPAGRRDGHRHDDDPDHRQRQPRVRGQPADADRHALRQGAALRPHAVGHRPRPQQPAEHELRDRLQHDLHLQRGNTAQGGTWGNPTSIYAPRFMRINYTLNF